MNEFSDLWNSTANFKARFGVSTVSPLLCQRHFMEEVTEFLQASCLLETLPYDPEHSALVAHYNEQQDQVVLEAADIFVTVMNVCQAHGLTLEELSEAILTVATKNDAKTHETHEFVGGKIRRKETINGR